MDSHDVARGNGANPSAPNGAAEPGPPAAGSSRYVADDAALAGLTERIKSGGRVAFDTEADSFHHYHEKVCLIQVRVNDEDFLVDPLAGLDLGAFLSVLSDKTLIVHDGGYDLRMLHRAYGFIPRGEVFDTMPAARLVGIERFGLGALVEQFFGTSIPKQGQKSDWSRRPLDDAQVRYAVQDTRYLPALADVLCERLNSLGRLQWHRQCCEAMVRAATQGRAAADPDRWRVKGSTKLKPRELAFLKEIWQWREREAQESDLPAFKVATNELIVEVAVWAAHHVGTHWSKGPRLPRNCTGRRLARLEAAIGAARNMAEADWPSPPRRREMPAGLMEVQPIVDALLTQCRHIAHGFGIAPSFLASRAMIEQIALKRPQTPEQITGAAGLMPWQAQLLHESIRNVLAKRR